MLRPALLPLVFLAAISASAAPFPLRVTVNPPRDPHGKPWLVSVWREGTGFASTGIVVEKAETDAKGTWTSGGQEPGRFTLILQDSAKSQYTRRNFDVFSKADASVNVDVFVFPVKGRVTIGGRPVATSLTFGEHGGAQALNARSNEKGEFEVLLTHSGDWRVFVHDEAEGIRATSRVTIEPDKPFEVVVPDTGFSGWVLGKDGNRLGKATLEILTGDEVIFHGIRPDGSFRVRGLRPGDIKITAGVGLGEKSRYVTIKLKEGSSTDGVELAMEPFRKFRGTLVSDGKPVAGASVTGYGIDGSMARVMDTRSGSAGEFELSFQTSVSRIWFIVTTADRMLQAYTATPADSGIRLEVAPAGGTVHLTWPATANPILIYDGTRIPTKHLTAWAQTHGKPVSGTELEIPALAPGTYRFCIDPKETSCREGVLAVGESLRLALE